MWPTSKGRSSKDRSEPSKGKGENAKVETRNLSAEETRRLAQTQQSTTGSNPPQFSAGNFSNSGVSSVSNSGYQSTVAGQAITGSMPAPEYSRQSSQEIVRLPASAGSNTEDKISSVWKQKIMGSFRNASMDAQSSTGSRGTIEAQEKARMNAQHESMVHLVDGMFDHFQNLAYDFNQVISQPELELTWIRPSLSRENISSWHQSAQFISVFTGRISTRFWTLMVRGTYEGVLSYIIPADKLLSFSSSPASYVSLLTFEPYIDASSVRWMVANRILSEQEMSSAFRAMLDTLVTVAQEDTPPVGSLDLFALGILEPDAMPPESANDEHSALGQELDYSARYKQQVSPASPAPAPQGQPFMQPLAQPKVQPLAQSQPQSQPQSQAATSAFDNRYAQSQQQFGNARALPPAASAEPQNTPPVEDEWKPVVKSPRRTASVPPGVVQAGGAQPAVGQPAGYPPANGQNPIFTPSMGGRTNPFGQQDAGSWNSVDLPSSTNRQGQFDSRMPSGTAGQDSTGPLPSAQPPGPDQAPGQPAQSGAARAYQSDPSWNRIPGKGEPVGSDLYSSGVRPGIDLSRQAVVENTAPVPLNEISSPLPVPPAPLPPVPQGFSQQNSPPSLPPNSPQISRQISQQLPPLVPPQVPPPVVPQMPPLAMPASQPPAPAISTGENPAQGSAAPKPFSAAQALSQRLSQSLRNRDIAQPKPAAQSGSENVHSQLPSDLAPVQVPKQVQLPEPVQVPEPVQIMVPPPQPATEPATASDALPALDPQALSVPVTAPSLEGSNEAGNEASQESVLELSAELPLSEESSGSIRLDMIASEIAAAPLPAVEEKRSFGRSNETRTARSIEEVEAFTQETADTSAPESSGDISAQDIEPASVQEEEIFKLAQVREQILEEIEAAIAIEDEEEVEEEEQEVEEEEQEVKEEEQEVEEEEQEEVEEEEQEEVEEEEQEVEEEEQEVEEEEQEVEEEEQEVEEEEEEEEKEEAASEAEEQDEEPEEEEEPQSEPDQVAEPFSEESCQDDSSLSDIFGAGEEILGSSASPPLIVSRSGQQNFSFAGFSMRAEIERVIAAFDRELESISSKGSDSFARHDLRGAENMIKLAEMICEYKEQLQILLAQHSDDLS